VTTWVTACGWWWVMLCGLRLRYVGDGVWAMVGSRCVGDGVGDAMWPVVCG